MAAETDGQCETDMRIVKWGEVLVTKDEISVQNWVIDGEGYTGPGLDPKGNKMCGFDVIEWAHKRLEEGNRK